MSLRLFIFTGIVFFATFFQTEAQKLKVKEADVWKYMHMLSSDEIDRRDEIGKYFQATDPPSESIECLAEFEPMAGVLISYPFGVPEELIKDLAKTDTLYTLIETTEQEGYLKNLYREWGIDLSYCKFLQKSHDSYWIRDYGPTFIAGSDSVGIVDFIYNRPRPEDDKIPEIVASGYKFPYFSMNVVHAGGNFMTDGFGIAASTSIVYSENQDRGISQELVDQNMKDYLGVHTYHVLDDPNNTYIKHIDCWGKFLDVDKIMIRSVPESHPQYDEIEATVDYLETQISSWGNNYQVFRVYTPNDEPYTNSFILNTKVFVPVTGGDWDDEALQSYKNAMPGYEVQGYTGSWLPTDALHCRVHEMADKHMIRIKHIPFMGEQKDKTGFTIDAFIKAYSGKPLNSDSVLVYYKADESLWQSIKMEYSSTDTYSVQLPAFGKDQTVQYYIYAVDQSGKRARLPLPGDGAPFVFVTGDVYSGLNPALASDNIKVYPNPVRNWLMISIDNEEKGRIVVELYNIKGQQVKSFGETACYKGGIKINLADIPDGVYILQLTSETIRKTIKIYKKH